VHTTTEHPFLTTDRGWVDAQDLVPGKHVQQLDGGIGVVVGTHVVVGIDVRYNLTVQDMHTYAVGANQWVVHNCNLGDTGRYGDLQSQSVNDGLELHHMPAKSVLERFGIQAADGFAVAIDQATHEATWTYKYGARRVVALTSNLSFRDILSLDLRSYAAAGGPRAASVAREAIEYWTRVAPHLM
jgi:hypothetical protein